MFFFVIKLDITFYIANLPTFNKNYIVDGNLDQEDITI